MTAIDVNPETQPSTSPADDFDHYYRPKDLEDGAGSGVPVLALCGAVGHQEPDHDPGWKPDLVGTIGGLMPDSRREDCPACVRIFTLILDADAERGRR